MGAMGGERKVQNGVLIWLLLADWQMYVMTDLIKRDEAYKSYIPDVQMCEKTARIR